MTTSNQKVGHHTLTGNPETDWSHVGSYLAHLYTESLTDAESPAENFVSLDQEFRARLMGVDGIDQLSEEDFALAASLTEAAGVDMSYWPGGENYVVSTVSQDNPLGLPGDLWAAVEEAEDGALVSALVKPAGEGELDIMVPGGRGWEPLTDLGVIEGYTLVGVSSDAVELFNNYDRANTLGVVSSYPISPEGPHPSDAQLAVPMPREIAPRRDDSDEFWTNAGEAPPGAEPVTASVTLNSAEDLTAAIEAAVADPEIRWYVERRMRALGLEAALPWQED